MDYDLYHNYDLELLNKELYVNNKRVYNTGYHPEADKWTTARTLTLTGYATGSVSWDGSGNVSMTTAVAKIKAGGNGPSNENLNSVFHLNCNNPLMISITSSLKTMIVLNAVAKCNTTVKVKL